MLIYIFHVDAVVVLSSKDEECCQGSCAHCTWSKQWRVSCSCSLGSAVLFTGCCVLVMDKQWERLWKAACENGSALLLTELGVLCRKELPLFCLPSSSSPCPLLCQLCVMAGWCVQFLLCFPKGLVHLD